MQRESRSPGKGGKTKQKSSFAGLIVGNVLTLSLDVTDSETQIVRLIVAERKYAREKPVGKALQQKLRGNPRVREVHCLIQKQM